MTYVITEACIGLKDLTCIDVCPVDCIHEDGEADLKAYIDPHVCIDCGACEAVCPVNAIVPDFRVPAAQQAFIDIDALWFRDKDAARAKVLEVHPV